MWEISYANILMYLATIPSYSKEGEENDHEELDVSEFYNMMNHGDT